jgi:hypothetical protein
MIAVSVEEDRPKRIQQHEDNAIGARRQPGQQLTLTGEQRLDIPRNVGEGRQAPPIIAQGPKRSRRADTNVPEYRL